MDNRQILIKMIEDYKQFDEVEAIAISGSSTAKQSDNHSDFDIYIYCTKEPDVTKRRQIAEKYSDTPEIDNHFFETGDVYTLRETNKPIDIMYRHPNSIEGNIKWVWEDVSSSKQHRREYQMGVGRRKRFSRIYHLFYLQCEQIGNPVR